MMTNNYKNQPEAIQGKPSTGLYNIPDEKTSERWLRRTLRSAGEAVSENQWLLPVAGSVIGVLLALVLDRVIPAPDPAVWTIDVGGARNGLISTLSILFAGLSIVLALASVTIQNVVGRFSLRMLRIYLRNPWDKAVIAVFAMSATFILSEWYLFRALPPEALAPIGGVLMSALLLFLCGAMMISYISILSGWFRVDRTVRRVAKLTLQAARSVERQHQQDSPVPHSAFQRQPDTILLLAHRSGYLTEVDLDGLLDLAVRYDVDFVIERGTGWSIVRGEPIGWIAAGENGSVKPELAENFADVIDITEERELNQDTGYGVLVLVDIAIMALSPGINDPNTAVQVIEEMTALFPQLAQVRLGPVGRVDAQGRQRVAVRALTFGEYVEMATAQIVMYTGKDPLVLMALKRFARVLQGLDLTENDRLAVETFEARVRELT